VISALDKDVRPSEGEGKKMPRKGSTGSLVWCPVNFLTTIASIDALNRARHPFPRNGGEEIVKAHDGQDTSVSDKDRRKMTRHDIPLTRPGAPEDFAARLPLLDGQ
jgi:hypothetical protein